ncbi:MAG: alpha/beta hydrolase [Acidobacteriaceae bacterium]|jgi:pimeloyl-ACP methyl ester carboxylesterase|nr:alpha/beta hydrolase [Acidobacteriaceae bacterium]
MRIVDQGHGVPIVLIPGIQGRWEYMRPAVDALAVHFRVVTFSLCDEPQSGLRFDSALGMDAYANQVMAALDACGLRRAIICGVSFGGLIALRCAARHPDRSSALILASTPGPRWHIEPKHERYSKRPWLFGPLFLAESPSRLREEIAIAIPDRETRRRFMRAQVKTLVTAPLSPSRLASRARLIGAYDRVADAARVTCPTLVLHGEPHLDHVVPVAGSTEYAQLIPGTRVERLPETGHLGTVTRPELFARAVRQFAESAHHHTHDSAA